MYVGRYPHEVPADGGNWTEEADLDLLPAAAEDFDPSGYLKRLYAKGKRARQFVPRHGRLVRRKDKTVHDRRWRAERGDRTVDFDPLDALDWFQHGRKVKLRADESYANILILEGAASYWGRPAPVVKPKNKKSEKSKNETSVEPESTDDDNVDWTQSYIQAT